MGLSMLEAQNDDELRAAQERERAATERTPLLVTAQQPLGSDEANELASGAGNSAALEETLP